MKNRKRVISTILSILLIALVFAAGCTPQARPDPNDPDRLGTRFDLGNDNYTRNGNNLGNQGYNDPNNGWYDRAIDKYGNNMTPNDRLYGFYGNNRNNNGNRIGNNNNNDMTYDNIPNDMSRFGMNTAGLRGRMETAVEGIQNVDDATVVNNGDTCYVGVDTEGTNAENVAALRTQIANKVRSVNPDIKRVYVTTDKNKLGQLRNYADDIDAGKPVRNFLNGLEDLFR